MLAKFFQDKEGSIVIWQNPNLALGTWIVAAIIARLLHGGRIDRTAEVIAFGALFTWAWLEIFKGDSYFRRAVGGVVLLMLIASHSH